MAHVIQMPKLSDTMEEGGIAKWLKKEGESVKVGETLVEIETDKATMEYESPEEGTLIKILVDAGKTAALNAPICIIGEKGEKVDLDVLGGKVSPKPPAKKDQQKPSASKTATVTAIKESEAAKNIASQRLRTSPLARKVAGERGINLADIKGSGPQGRVILRDIEKVAGQATPAISQPAMQLGQEDKTIALSMMRKTIAKRLHAAKNDAPHFYLTVSANMLRAEEWRKKLNEDIDKTKAVKISLNDIITLAVAKALGKHPEVNSSWQQDAIIQYGNVHVAVAVALPSGLVTPVIRHTDLLGVRAIAEKTKDLVAKAKANQLANEDYLGGTFTISNLGMFGIEEFTAIINPPQAAILAVGKTVSTPWVDDHSNIVVEPRMKMTLSCDHRVIDGVTGALFLQTLVAHLEDPMMMLA